MYAEHIEVVFFALFWYYRLILFSTCFPKSNGLFRVTIISIDVIRRIRFQMESTMAGNVAQNRHRTIRAMVMFCQNHIREFGRWCTAAKTMDRVYRGFLCKKIKYYKKISETRVLFKVRITYKDELLGTRPFCRPLWPPIVPRGREDCRHRTTGPRASISHKRDQISNTIICKMHLQDGFGSVFYFLFIYFEGELV